MLVGTMNPEEGDLRPQFLDRFGLSLTIKSLDDIDMRQAIVRRRIEFDQNPETFLKTWSVSEHILAGMRFQPRSRVMWLPRVPI